MTRRLLVAAAMLGLLASAACGGGSERGTGRIVVRDASVGATGADVAAAYLTIDGGRAADRLVDVVSPDAQRVTIHAVDTAGGAGSMRRIESLDVPAGGSVRLVPGGTHLMVEGIRRPVRAGDRITLRLRFEFSRSIDVTATAVPLQELPELLGRR